MESPAGRQQAGETHPPQYEHRPPAHEWLLFKEIRNRGPLVPADRLHLDNHLAALDLGRLEFTDGILFIRSLSDPVYYAPKVTFTPNLKTLRVTSAGAFQEVDVNRPLGTTDFSSYLLQAQSSGGDVLALANGGADTTNAIKQAVEFGLTKTMTIAGLVVNINMIQGVGVKDSQGILAVMPFYWDLNDGTRAFAKRFAAAHPRHIMPNDMQAGVYSATAHYLKAVAALKDGHDGKVVVAKMKELPTSDPLYGDGVIRADGRKIHPVHLYETKKPSESTGDWDYFKTIATVPADQAFRPLASGGCALVKG